MSKILGFDAYVEAALWSSLDEEGEAFDKNYTVEDISPEALETMEKDMLAFLDYLENNRIEWRNEWTEEQLGHDFWLTRNGHGSGFWDRGYGKPGEASYCALGVELTKAAKLYGEQNLYIGDDSWIYVA